MDGTAYLGVFWYNSGGPIYIAHSRVNAQCCDRAAGREARSPEHGSGAKDFSKEPSRKTKNHKSSCCQNQIFHNRQFNNSKQAALQPIKFNCGGGFICIQWSLNGTQGASLKP